MKTLKPLLLAGAAIALLQMNVNAEGVPPNRLAQTPADGVELVEYIRRKSQR